MPSTVFQALSPEFAEAIATYDGGISLNGLRSLPAETAEALASHRDGFLSLDGLRSLTLRAARSLSSFEDVLSLGVIELSPRVAEALSGHHGDLYLNQITVLSDVAAKMLAKHMGHLVLNGLASLSETQVSRWHSTRMTFHLMA